MPTPPPIPPPPPLPEFCLKQNGRTISSVIRRESFQRQHHKKNERLLYKKKKKNALLPQIPHLFVFKVICSLRNISPHRAVYVYIQVTSRSENCITWHAHCVDSCERKGGGGGSKLGRERCQAGLGELRGGQRGKGWVGLEANASVKVASHALAGGLSG